MKQKKEKKSAILKKAVADFRGQVGQQREKLGLSKDKLKVDLITKKRGLGGCDELKGYPLPENALEDPRSYVQAAYNLWAILDRLTENVEQKAYVGIVRNLEEIPLALMGAVDILTSPSNDDTMAEVAKACSQLLGTYNQLIAGRLEKDTLSSIIPNLVKKGINAVLPKGVTIEIVADKTVPTVVKMLGTFFEIAEGRYRIGQLSKEIKKELEADALSDPKQLVQLRQKLLERLPADLQEGLPKELNHRFFTQYAGKVNEYLERIDELKREVSGLNLKDTMPEMVAIAGKFRGESSEFSDAFLYLVTDIGSLARKNAPKPVVEPSPPPIPEKVEIPSPVELMQAEEISAAATEGPETEKPQAEVILEAEQPAIKVAPEPTQGLPTTPPSAIPEPTIVSDVEIRPVEEAIEPEPIVSDVETKPVETADKDDPKIVMQEVLDHYASEIATLAGEIKEVEDKYVKLGETIQTLNGEIGIFQKEKESIKTEIIQLSEQLNKPLDSEGFDQLNRLNQLGEEIQQVPTEASILRDKLRLQTQRTELAALQKAISEDKLDAQIAKGKLGLLEIDNLGIDNEEELNAYLGLQNKIVSGASNLFVSWFSNKPMVSDVETSDYEAQKNKLLQTLGKKDKIIEGKQGELNAQKADPERLKGLRTELTALEKSVESRSIRQKAEKSTISKELESLKKELDAVEARIASLTEQVSEKNSERTKLGGEQEKLTQRKGNAEIAHKGMQETFNSILREEQEKAAERAKEEAIALEKMQNEERLKQQEEEEKRTEEAEKQKLEKAEMSSETEEKKVEDEALQELSGIKSDKGKEPEKTIEPELLEVASSGASSTGQTVSPDQVRADVVEKARVDFKKELDGKRGELRVAKEEFLSHMPWAKTTEPYTSLKNAPAVEVKEIPAPARQGIREAFSIYCKHWFEYKAIKGWVDRANKALEQTPEMAPKLSEYYIKSWAKDKAAMPSWQKGEVATLYGQ